MHVSQCGSEPGGALHRIDENTHILHPGDNSTFQLFWDLVATSEIVQKSLYTSIFKY